MEVPRMTLACWDIGMSLVLFFNVVPEETGAAMLSQFM